MSGLANQSKGRETHEIPESDETSVHDFRILITNELHDMAVSNVFCRDTEDSHLDNEIKQERSSSGFDITSDSENRVAKRI